MSELFVLTPTSLTIYPTPGVRKRRTTGGAPITTPAHPIGAGEQMKTVPVGKSHSAMLDDSDFPLVLRYKWNLLRGANGRLYAYRWWLEGRKRRYEYLHHLLMGHNRIDHRNRNGLDCQRANMRVASRSQNAANSKLPANNTTGFKGVKWCTETYRLKPWQAQITVDGEFKSLGYYATPEEAAAAYVQAAKKYFGEFARFH
jgi:hypothetical protein